jgi:myo-inositol catabolism protein IolH
VDTVKSMLSMNMKIALDPFMHRRLGLTEVARLAAQLGYEYLELSPRHDFMPIFTEPRADNVVVGKFKMAMRAAGVRLASLMAVYHWSSPDEEERLAALRYWRRAVEIAVETQCRTLNTEFSGLPDTAAASEKAFTASIEELLPLFQREGVAVHIEPHPGDFVEDGNSAVDIVRRIGSPNLRYLYCAPHTFHMGEDMAGMIRHAAPVLAHVHLADSLNFRAGLRYIVNPIGAPVRIHQHLNIGEGEIDWDVFFSTLADIGFDGILTSCVFAWEDRAVESSRLMRERIQSYLNRYPTRTSFSD